jgi:hypothetical protein
MGYEHFGRFFYKHIWSPCPRSRSKNPTYILVIETASFLHTTLTSFQADTAVVSRPRARDLFFPSKSYSISHEKKWRKTLRITMTMGNNDFWFVLALITTKMHSRSEWHSYHQNIFVRKTYQATRGVVNFYSAGVVSNDCRIGSRFDPCQ